MNIYEAMKKAHCDGKFITNKNFESIGLKIKPDPVQNYCNVYKKESTTPMWQPGINDFLDETWEVVD